MRYLFFLIIIGIYVSCGISDTKNKRIVELIENCAKQRDDFLGETFFVDNSLLERNNSVKSSLDSLLSKKHTYFTHHQIDYLEGQRNLAINIDVKKEKKLGNFHFFDSDTHTNHGKEIIVQYTYPLFTANLDTAVIHELTLKGDLIEGWSLILIKRGATWEIDVYRPDDINQVQIH